MIEKLKVCPFCGHRAELRHSNQIGTVSTNLKLSSLKGESLTHYIVQCTECKIKTPTRLDIPGAITFWNRRVSNLTMNPKGKEE